MPRALIFSLLLLFTACSDTDLQATIKLQGSTMGTQYHITLVRPNNTNNSELKKQVDDLLVEINQQMSTYIPSSEISQFNQTKQQDWFPVSSDFAHVVSSAQDVSKRTDGAFDITVAPLIDLWGFGAKERLVTPSDLQVVNTLQNTGYQLLEVRLSPPALRKQNSELRIDLSAIAKGFAVDKIAKLLDQKGYIDYLVEIGGEIRNRGFNQKGKPWQIGIETPDHEDWRVNKTLLSSNLAVATSGDYRNFFIKEGVRYSHTINPVAGKPVTNSLASITILHKSTMMADAYATAFMVMGDEKGKAFAKANGLRVNMISRKASGYQNWQNIDELRMPQSLGKCQKRDGCVYFE
jgi:thiamine biosynthesis lipoprotein